MSFLKPNAKNQYILKYGFALKSGLEWSDRDDILKLLKFLQQYYVVLYLLTASIRARYN